METVYLSVDPINPDPEAITTAALFLEREELVAFPTETVYGLGALVRSSHAVKRIFNAKARSERNPLQVHISSLNQLHDIISYLPGEAEALMAKFWPGPLSIILPAASHIPDEVCAGTGTVGLRMPSHPVALALIDKTGPLAATSANLSGRPSPLSADDVRADLDGRICAVLDAGRTGSGLESTVLNLCGGSYRILRRGGIDVEEIEEVLGKRIEVVSQVQAEQEHYKIQASVFIAGDQKDFERLLHDLISSRGTVGIVYNDLSPETLVKDEIFSGLKVYHLSLSQPGFNLYSILRQSEEEGLQALVFAPLPIDCKGVAASIIDRILAASTSKQ